MSPEDEEFQEVERQHAQQREKMGQEEWDKTYFTRTIHLWAAIGRRAREEIEIRVRDLSESSHGNTREAGAAGDMSYSGAHTWGSAVALAQFILAKPFLVEGKDVMELGAGTGLPSLAALRCAASVIATDRTEDLIANVAFNASLNTENILLGGAARLRTQVFCWEDGLSAEVKVDVLLGSEIMHEERTMPLLARIVCTVLKGGGGVFYGVSPAGARRGAIDSFKQCCAEWSREQNQELLVEEQPFPSEMMLEDYTDEWNVGSVEGDELCLITVTKP